MSIDALFQKAHEKHRQKKFEAAAKLYREVLGLQPDHLDANYLLGTVYAETGRAAEAEPYLVKAAELDPASPYIKINLGNVYKLQKQYDKALEQFTAALALDDNLLPAHFGVATVMEKTGDHSEKMAHHVNRALAINPNIPQLHHLVANVLAKAGMYEEALRSFKNVATLDPGYKDIHLDLGVCFLQLGNRQDAAAALRKAVKKNPASIPGRYYLCEAEGKTPDAELQQAFNALSAEASA